MVESVRLPEALRRYLESFSAIQKAQIKCVRSRVGMFVEAYREALVTEIRPKDIADYLFKNYHQKSPKTYNEVLGYIRSFFNWCKRKDVALCVENPCDDLRGKSIHYEEPKFVTAETVRHVFDLLERKCDSVTKQQVIWFFAIWFFCGIRTEEILRLRHKDVNIDEGWIRVAFPKGFQHGVAPRMVEMPDVCKAWLRAYDATPDGTDDKFIDRFAFPHYAKSVLMKAAKDCGETDFKLVDNAGRHSFVTMHVALYNNPSRTEALAGTSKDMRVNNYMGLATKAQARAYFDVMPDKTEETK
jgi:site-specific recombinase XerD